MTTNRQLTTPSAFDEFYNSPSPSRAVALAIADHKNYTAGPIWEFVEQLQKAQDRCDAYPRLVAALRTIKEQTYVDAEGPELRAQNECNHRRASDILHDLGEA